MKSAIHVALVFGIAIQACPRAYADVVRVVEGTVLDVPVTAGGASVTIVTPMGHYTYPRSDVAKLEPTRPPEREWPARREKAMRSGTPDGEMQKVATAPSPDVGRLTRHVADVPAIRRVSVDVT